MIEQGPIWNLESIGVVQEEWRPDIVIDNGAIPQSVSALSVAISYREYILFGSQQSPNLSMRAIIWESEGLLALVQILFLGIGLDIDPAVLSVVEGCR